MGGSWVTSLYLTNGSSVIRFSVPNTGPEQSVRTIRQVSHLITKNFYNPCIITEKSFPKYFILLCVHAPFSLLPAIEQNRQVFI